MARFVYSVLFSIIIGIYVFNVEQVRQTSLSILVKSLTYFQNTYFEEEIIESRQTIDNSTGMIQLNPSEYKCLDHRYKIRMISREPLIIYIEKFLVPYEIRHLIELAAPHFAPSLTHDDDMAKLVRSDYRTSWTAYIDRQETPVVKCIEDRFARFQGNVDSGYLETLQVVRYTADQEYKPHFDWFPEEEIVKHGSQRITTFFTYLYSNCSEGETEFVNIIFNRSIHGKFCDILVCDETSNETGIRFRPISGNSVFWYNIDKQGQVDYYTHHAGRPPKADGLKIGLNTWTRSKYVPTKLRKDVGIPNLAGCNYQYLCIEHRKGSTTKTRIISRTPLIIYIDNFLSPYEIQHLIELATPLFSQSQINDNNGKRLHDKPYRTSSTAFIDRRETPVVECIEHRFAQFQGNLHPEYVEPLQVVKYTFGQE
ncbi:unnamed protein product, partial [Adineta ricciae]